MNPHNSLRAITVLSFCGILFSGYLSYRELFTISCNLGFVSCGTNTGPIFGMPACVYGLIMYSIVFALAVTGMLHKNCECCCENKPVEKK